VSLRPYLRSPDGGRLAARWRDRASGLRPALRRGAERIRPLLYKAVYDRTPDASGKLRDGLYVEIRGTPAGFDVIAGFRGVPYARAIEQGRKAVDIYPKRKAALKFDVGGFPVFAKRVHQEARPGKWMLRDGGRFAQGKAGRVYREELRRLYLRGR
jgi:hypothetical protein